MNKKCDKVIIKSAERGETIRGIAVLGGLAMLFGGAIISISALTYACIAKAKAEKILSTTNYEKFNEEQKILQIDKLLKELEEGKISSQEFLRMSNEIEDYDMLEYVKTSPDVSVECRVAYLDAFKDIQNAEIITKLSTFGIIPIGIAIAGGNETIAKGVDKAVEIVRRKD